MANICFYLLVFLSFHYMTKASAGPDPTIAPSASTASISFIQAACKATRYYALCVESLSAYANTIQQSERQLATAALAVTLTTAQSTETFVAELSKSTGVKPRESQALKDCIDNMVDSVDRLNQSMQELGQMNNQVAGQDFMWHMSNVQTWVSAALTDENTCLDGFSEPSLNGNVKAVIRRRIVYVAEVTSNALALVNRFAERRRPGSTLNTP